MLRRLDILCMATLMASCLVAILVIGSANSHAMPMFARKEQATCGSCHTIIPRLNSDGYKYRARGFRTKDTWGEPKKEDLKEPEKGFSLGNYFSARGQARFDVQETNQPNGAPQANVIGGVAGERTNTTAFSFMEFTLYPLTGSWGKYFSSLAELSVSPEDFFEVENAYVRFNYGSYRKFFSARAGVFHPWEGFGASDRPFSNVRPLFQNVPISAGGRAVPYVYQPWGLDEVGAEAGVDINHLSLRGAILGGTFMRFEEGAGAFLPFPAQTGPWKGANQAVPELNKRFDTVGHSRPDFSFNATYILNPDSGGITLLYYHGNMATPTKCTDGTAIGAKNPVTGETCGVTASTIDDPFGTIENTDFDFTKASAFRNDFDRYAAYASYPVGKHFLPQGGFNYGRDTNPNGTKFDSKGAFAEGTYTFNRYVAAGFRYDWYRPRYPAPNTQWAVTPYVNIPLQNGIQFIAEYQHRDFQINAANHRQNDTFQVRFIFIR